MPRIALTVAAVVLVVSGTASAQAFIQYVSQKDGFGVSFPGEPTVRDMAWTSEHGVPLPARVYTVDNKRGKYSMTVVDYKDVEKLSAERAAQCQKGGGEGDACMNSWRSDVAGAIVYATWQLMQRDAKVTFYGFMIQDLVSGHQIQLLNADQSRTFAAINMHGTKLYVLEATVPRGLPAPGLFQQSLMFIDEQGRSIRYRSYYSHTYSDEWTFPAQAPPRAR
jgi:hypothetical protein